MTQRTPDDLTRSGSPQSFEAIFAQATGQAPWPWQKQLAGDPDCCDRVIRIPTGFGKTAGTVLSWLFHRVLRGDERWPRRLVFCLPMRVLVEQTESNVQAWLATLGLQERVSVHVLMGGVAAGRWVADPERPAILIGTQDMLLSRALMRGYASPRARWPMEFALLHHDALWVVDEVQLMGVGLATSSQLAAFHGETGSPPNGVHRPPRFWWMSATLQPTWLATVDHAPRVAPLAERMLSIPSDARSGGLYETERHLELASDRSTPKEIAELVRARHAPRTVTLVIVNTVRRAVELSQELSKGKGLRDASGAAIDVRLVHSRFRGHERRAWATDFLNRAACHPEKLEAGGRVIVATQVVEAGVDVSASLLITDLAPWSSLVQRFGRCARYVGERGTIVVVGSPPAKEADAAPYALAELSAAAAGLADLGPDAGPAALEQFEEGLSAERRGALFPYAPGHVLRRKDLDDLFDTTADLRGADIDVARYIRNDQARDVKVFWRDVDPKQRYLDDQPFPARDELCPAPLHGKGGVDGLVKERAVWVYDYLDERWSPVRSERGLGSGMTLMFSSQEGGYDLASGWDPGSKTAVPVVPVKSDELGEPAQRLERATSGQGDDALSEAQWQSIAEHGRDVGANANALGKALALPPATQALLELAGRWHDAGKAHPVFQRAISDEAKSQSPRPDATDWGKAPKTAWRRPAYPSRPGFRHELASTLMLYETLRRAQPEHPALLGESRELLTALGIEPELPDSPATSALADELARLSAVELDLVAYLVCSHHGKVRCQWSPSPNDGDDGKCVLGIAGGDVVPATTLATPGGDATLPELELSLDQAAMGAGPRHGRSWTERVERLLRTYGPFQLALLECVLIACDWRASKAVEERV